MSEWISVSDRLPEEYTAVKIKLHGDTWTMRAWHERSGEFYIITQFKEDGKICYSVDYNTKLFPTHWRELPTPK